MVEREQAEEQSRLLARISAGDGEAAATFYDQVAGPLYSVAVRILGDAAEAQEVIQDAFVQIWEKAATFDPMLGSAFHWALSIARHRSIDRLRGRQRRARLLEEFQAAAPPDSFQENSQAEHALRTEEAAAIRAAVKELPPEQRHVIELAFFGGKTHTEIAEMLQEPLGTIKARIRRGMLKLRDSLQTYA